MKTATIRGVTYTVPAHTQFIEDMEAAGLGVELYHGRMMYHGPAVRVDVLQEAMQETRVPLSYDNLGHGYIVHPKAGDMKLQDEHDPGEEDA